MEPTEHQLQESKSGFHCPQCGRDWARRPKYACPGVHQYEWGNVPENMKTERQLHEDGLRATGQPVGCLWWHKMRSYIWLYDIKETEPRPTATVAQLKALEKAREALTCKGCGRQVAKKRHLYGGYCEHCATVMWARACLADPDVRVMDTETTGLYGDAQIIEISILNVQGEVLLDTLVKPDGPIPAEASRINGITDDMVVGAPTWPEIWPKVVEAIRGKDVITYNVEFDRRMVTQTRKRYGIEEKSQTKGWQCLMETYKDWTYSRRWCSLSSACEDMKVQAGGHRSLGDAQAALGLLGAIAAVKLKSEREEVKMDDKELGEQ